MKKTGTRTRRGQAPTTSPTTVTVQMPLPMLALMSGIGDDFHALCIDAGRQVLGAMMGKCSPWPVWPDGGMFCRLGSDGVAAGVSS